MQNKKFDKLTRIGEIPSRIYIILALVMMGISTALCVFVPSVNVAICGATFIALYGVISLIIYFIYHHKLNVFRYEKYASDEQAGSVIHAFRNDLSLPYAVINEQGKIITSNNAFSEALGITETIFNLSINELCGIKYEKLIPTATVENEDEEAEERSVLNNVPFESLNPSEIAEFGNRKYRMACHGLTSKGKNYNMIVFFDVTELASLSALYKNNLTAVGYIVIDNLEEIAQYVKVNYQDETRAVGKRLKEWASHMGGVLCEYESNKFLLLFNQKMLSECVKNKFSILNEIHKIEISEAHIQLTASMGISTLGSSLDEREHNAMIALDMAHQRGGDQVVLKNEQGTFYFGAKTKALQKRTKGQAKIICSKLESLIENSTNVLVMGHRNPDFDCIGACIGITTLIRNVYSDVDIKIVTDVQNENFVACASRLARLAEYSDTFIDGVSALEHNHFGTLLIIVDANNINILESPELAKSAFKKIIIDHHIKKEEFDEEPELAYIDPSASSTCELISEMLEEVLAPEITFKEEASIMMSGIMLDTNHFTRTVGMRTFAAALYLKNAGADTEYARTFFEEGFDDYLSASQFGSAAKIYRDNIAITSISDAKSSNARVLAAKAADKLLAIKNVNAAFALIPTGTTINISARSDGSINVQIILEQLGGGGHFDMAGAAITDSTIEETECLLTDAIDRYYESLESENQN